MDPLGQIILFWQLSPAHPDAWGGNRLSGVKSKYDLMLGLILITQEHQSAKLFMSEQCLGSWWQPPCVGAWKVTSKVRGPHSCINKFKQTKQNKTTVKYSIKHHKVERTVTWYIWFSIGFCLGNGDIRSKVDIYILVNFVDLRLSLKFMYVHVYWLTDKAKPSYYPSWWWTNQNTLWNLQYAKLSKYNWKLDRAPESRFRMKLEFTLALKVQQIVDFYSFIFLIGPLMAFSVWCFKNNFTRKSWVLASTSSY